MTAGPSIIGEQIQRLRVDRHPTMTQAVLAERAEVSLDVIKKLEQGRKQTASLATLKRIARALDVDVGAIIGGQSARINDQDRGVWAIRRAITAVKEDHDPAGLDELLEAARTAWGTYWNHEFTELGGLLPTWIATARASAHAASTADKPKVYAALSDIYGAAASMLVPLGSVDLAYLTMDRAIGAADHAEDPLRRAALSGWMSWLLMHHEGSEDQSQQLAIAEADHIEPDLSRRGAARPEEIAVWGGLLLSGGIAAARADRPDEADELLTHAASAATRLNANHEVRIDYARPFGLPVVIQVQVDACVVTGRPGKALDIAKQMPPDAALPLAGKARHLADVAYAQTTLGKDREATSTLVGIERMAPGWMRTQPWLRPVVAELLGRERRARSPLRDLARLLRVE